MLHDNCKITAKSFPLVLREIKKCIYLIKYRRIQEIAVDPSSQIHFAPFLVFSHVGKELGLKQVGLQSQNLLTLYQVGYQTKFFQKFHILMFFH